MITNVFLPVWHKRPLSWRRLTLHVVIALPPAESARMVLQMCSRRLACFFMEGGAGKCRMNLCRVDMCPVTAVVADGFDRPVQSYAHQLKGRLMAWHCG